MTTQEATYSLLNKLRSIYSEGEASQVTDWVMEFITGSKKTERMLYKNAVITSNEEIQLQQFAERLLKLEPVQYVLNEAWFCGLRFYVDKNVLIPRPETEELVEWVISSCRFPINELKILDIGTGSGCIPVSLKRRLRKAEVWACDVSAASLDVAKRNADTLGAAINFIQLDFLNRESWNQLARFDIIISNPPYVPEKDKAKMDANVLNYEPALALFVPDNNPLLFYEAIADFGKEHLAKDGVIYFEIHESLGKSAMELLSAKGYKSELKKDMQGKDRMLMAVLNY